MSDATAASAALLPPLPLDAMYQWLVALGVVASLALAWRKLFGNGHTVVRRYHCERQHHVLAVEFDKLNSRLARIDHRLSVIEGRLAAGDERRAE